MRLLTAFLFLLVFFAVAACSTPKTVTERFQSLDYDAKSVYLTYYPYLTSDQRGDLLSIEDGNPRALIESWSGELNDPRHEVGSFDEMMGNPARRKIAALEIKVDSPDRISSGTEIPVHAFAIYSGGRIAAEVTQDTAWRVDRNLGRIEDGKLRFECVDSDLSIGASFVGEQEATKVLEIRKPLSSLQLKVAETYTGADTGYNFKLILLAHCQDGTVSDVSCQADWSSESLGGKVQGCGNVLIRSKEKLADDGLFVTARYGTLSIRQKLQPPIR
jgi:hypothetical protein